MRVPRITAAIAATALGVLPACAHAADEALQLAPSSPWVMDYAADSCALRRAFQSGDQRATLEFRQFSPGGSLLVAVESPTLPAGRAALKVRFDPDEAFYGPWTALLFGDAEKSVVVFTDDLRPNAHKQQLGARPDWPDADRDGRERAISGLTMTGAFERDVTLRTGALHAPMEAMRSCLDELLGHWELDPVIQRSLSRELSPLDLQRWARRVQEEYPVAMLHAGRSGIVPVRMVVGPDGRPTSCTPNKDFSAPGFEEQACKSLMRYARFEPALDAGGQAVESYYSTTVIYQVTAR